MPTLAPDAVWTPQGLVTDAVVRVRDGLIDAITPSQDADEDAERLAGKVLIPGLVNAHSHAFQRAFRGHVQWTNSSEDTFWTWRDAMYRAANALGPDEIEAISRLAFLEMAQAGVTHVGEFHYLQHGPSGERYDDPDELAKRVIQAALDVGLRITLLRVAYAESAPGKPLMDTQQRFGDRSPHDVLAAIARLRTHPDPRVNVGLAPHSIRAVPPDWLAAFADFDGPVHAHVSEQPAENNACLQAYGKTPLQMFDEAGLLHERFTAVHLTYPMEGDAERLRARGAAVCVCPTTELDLGDGFLPLSLRGDTRLCVGSDSHAQIDLFAEARALELHGRALANRRHVMTPVGERHGLAERLLRHASVDGSVSLGAPSGGIAPGQPADLVAVDLTSVAAAGVPPLEAVVMGARPEWVQDVWVDGSRVLRGGKHPQQAQWRSEALQVIDALYR